jgi:hypothetical protein
VLGIVLPGVARPIATPIGNVVLSIGVVHERIVVIYVYVVVSAPPAVATPSAASPSRPNRQPNTEGYSRACDISARGRIVDRRIWIYGRAVNNRGIVTGHVHNIRFALLDDDHLLALDYLGFHLHLLVGFQIPSALCLGAHPLYGVHHGGLLCQNGISEVCGPLDVVREAFDNVRKGS